MNQRELQKQQSFEKIVQAATTLFGKQGLHATGIDQIMAKAGLTAGAFYAHFKSKDHLIEEVLFRVIQKRTDRPLKNFLDEYLTVEHRDNLATACPLATLGSDLARGRKKLRHRIAERLQATILKHLPPDPPPELRKKALKGLSLAVGALILSRITEGTELSDEFLNCHR